MHTEIFARIDEKGAGLVRVFGVVLVTLVIVALAPGLVLAQEQADDRQYETEARAALEEYFLAWNAADNDAVAAISMGEDLDAPSHSSPHKRPVAVLAERTQPLRSPPWGPEPSPPCPCV